MTELQIFGCRHCGTAWFPERLRCPACGGAAFARMPAGEGVVEEATTLHRTPSTEGTRLGSVRLAAGPVVIVRLEDGIEHRTRVRLHVGGDNAIRARRA